MREIKFRIYFNFFEDGYMDFPYCIENGGKTVIYDGDDYEVGEEVKLMQYTGLKDKNGTDIYEGDFIFSVTEDGCFLQLIGFGYDDKEYTEMLTGFKIVKGKILDVDFWDEELRGNDVYLVHKYNIPVSEDKGEKYIQDGQWIIGNKYQNPELMELLEG